jgi:hypothetical protein
VKKKRIPTWFSERQLAQLRDTSVRLRKLNRNALSLLRHITLWRLSDKQLIDTRESLELTVALMSSALRRRQQLVAIGREQNPSILRVIFHSMGADEVAPLRTKRDDTPEPLRPDRAWNDELHSLLEIVHKAEGVIEDNPRRGSAKELIAALARLTNLLLKQQRHLQELEPEEEPQIEVIYKRGNAIGHSDEMEAPPTPQPGEMEVFSEDQ